MTISSLTKGSLSAIALRISIYFPPNRVVELAPLARALILHNIGYTVFVIYAVFLPTPTGKVINPTYKKNILLIGDIGLRAHAIYLRFK